MRHRHSGITTYGLTALYAVHTIRLLDKLSQQQLHSVNTKCDSWTDNLSNSLP